MIKPRDLMELAERLAAIGAEAEGRAAVSRAYYSAFHHAKSLLEDKCGLKLPNSAEAHKKVCFCLEASKNNELIDIADRLHTLRRSRNHADYDLTESRFVKIPNVQTQMTTAKKIVADIDAAALRMVDFRQEVRRYASEVLKLALR
ncbi:MAG TPA: hypothetical protein VGI40_10370 [Pirellulaceae bacterium]|jgi:uncharacterized protein (UPF0332 family)